MINHEGISYLDSDDIYYYHCHAEKNEIDKYVDKWYKVKCVISFTKIPDHMNVYFIPQPKLEDFLKNNPERLLDIEPISFDEVTTYFSKFGITI